MKLLTLSLLVFIFNGGLQQESSSIATPTGATSGLSPVTPTPDSNKNGEKRSFPIVIPYNNSQDVKNIQPNWGTCLLYLEGITIVAIDHGTSKSGGQKAVFAHITGAQDKNTWIFSSESINCNIKSGPTKDTILNGSFAEFRVTLNILEGVSAIDGKSNIGYNVSALDFVLHFDVPSLDNWYLDHVTLKDIKIVKVDYLSDDLSISNFANTTVDAKPANIRGFYGYSYGCSATPAIFFESDKQISIGLQFNNFQIEPYNIYINNGSSTGKIGVQFKSNVNDCVPTFTTGSLMSIISILVLFAVFIFGFLMLNSVQTMDRFDDPKGRQIVITTKE